VPSRAPERPSQWQRSGNETERPNQRGLSTAALSAEIEPGVFAPSVAFPCLWKTATLAAQRSPPNEAVLDTARAGRAPSRSSGPWRPSSASPLGNGGTAEKGHYVDYPPLAGAPCVALKVPEPHDMVPADQRLDAERVVAELWAHGVEARAEADVDRLVRFADGARPGDVVLVMSNGAFGGFIDRLLAAFRSSARDA